MVFIPDGGNIKNKNNGLFSQNDPGIVFKVLEAIPGFKQAEKILTNEFDRTFKNGPKKQDTFLQDYAQLPVEFAKDVVRDIKSLPGFLASAVYTPAISIADAVGPYVKKGYQPYGTVDLTPVNVLGVSLGKQKSFQQQRQELKNEGAGEVVSDALPVVQWVASIGSLHKTVNAAEQAAPRVKKFFEDYADSRDTYQPKALKGSDLNDAFQGLSHAEKIAGMNTLPKRNFTPIADSFRGKRISSPIPGDYSDEEIAPTLHATLFSPGHTPLKLYKQIQDFQKGIQEDGLPTVTDEALIGKLRDQGIKSLNESEMEQLKTIPVETIREISRGKGAGYFSETEGAVIESRHGSAVDTSKFSPAQMAIFEKVKARHAVLDHSSVVDHTME